MRRLATIVLVSSVFLGCTPAESVKIPQRPKASSGTSSASLPASKVELASIKANLPMQKAGLTSEKQDAKLVVFHVPGMSCPHACWPEVKKTLEGQTGVASVELAPQANEEEINDKTVFVKLKGDFDSVAAIAALDKIGFDGSEVVQK